MRDVYLGIDTQPGQLFGKLDGVQMLGGDGQVPLAVGKGCFQDEMAQIRNAIDGAPEFLGGQRVARIDEAAGRAPDVKAHGRHCVVGRDGADGAVADLHGAAHLQRAVDHPRPLEVRDLGEVGPDDPVENVLFQRLDGLGQGMDDDGTFPAAAYGIEHQRQRTDVVKVRVGEKNVVDAAHVLDGQVLDASAGIDQDVVVDEEG